MSTRNDSKVLSLEVLPLIKKNLNAKGEKRIPKINFTEDAKFGEI